MMEYPNRTHCICQGRNTQLHLFELITRYLDQNLKGDTSAADCADGTGRQRDPLTRCSRLSCPRP